MDRMRKRRRRRRLDWDRRRELNKFPATNMEQGQQVDQSERPLRRTQASSQLCGLQRAETYHQIEQQSRSKRRPTAITKFYAPLIFKLIIYLTILLPILGSSHSNINSVWLSKEDAHTWSPKGPSQHQQTSANSLMSAPVIRLTQRSGDSRLSPESMGLGNKIAATNNHPLQASSSSLQPTIAVLDNENISERRLDSAPVAFENPRLPRYNASSSSSPLYGTFSNEASSLDHLWSLNQSNAQVHFDEEHMNGLNAARTITTTSAGPSGAHTTERRQDLNGTTTPAPQYDAPHQQSNAATTEANFPNLEATDSPPMAMDNDSQLPDKSQQLPSSKSSQHQQEMNYLMGNLNNHQDQIDSKRDMMAPITSSENNNNSRSSTPFIYYLPDGSKWNPTSSSDENQDPPSTNNSGRRKLHNSGTQYNLKDLERVLNYAQQTQQPSYGTWTSGGRNHERGVITKTRQVAGGEAANSYVVDDYRYNYPSYYYAGSGHDQVQFDSNQHPSGTNPTQAASPHHQLKAPSSQNLHYGFLPTTQLTSEATQPPTTKTTPLPATIFTTTSFSPNINTVTSSQTPLPLNYQRYPNTNIKYSTPRLASRPVVRPRIVTHPTKRPIRFEHPAPGELLVDNRRDISGIWRQRPPSTRSRHHSSLLDLGQRPSILGGLSSYSSFYDHINGGRYISNRPVAHKSKPTSSPSKAKKSILGSLGSKLNSWVDRDQKLEDSFYGIGSHQHRRRAKPLANWNAANLYYITAPQSTLASVLEPAHAQLVPPSYLSQPGSTTGLSGSLAGQQNRLLHGSALNYYPNLYGGAQPIGSQSHFFTGNHHLSPLVVRQPTVAPATSSLNKFYPPSGDHFQHHHLYSGTRSKFPLHSLEQHLAQSSHHLSQYLPQKTSSGLIHNPDNGAHQQQPANFIPVVAVSVTKTSPAPRPMSQVDSESLNGGASLDQATDINNELMDYLYMKTGDGQGYDAYNRNRNRLHGRGLPSNGQQNYFQEHNNNNDINMVRAQLDDHGHVASGSISGDTAFSRQHQQQTMNNGSNVSGEKPGGGSQNSEQTTTVKSAVFGYLPHEANKPLLQAINMLPNYAHNQRGQLSAADAYVGQLSEHDPTHSLLSPHLPLRGANDATTNLLPVDEPPSLGLQLQANNFAQNDIAHPFSSTGDSSGQRKMFRGGLQSLLNQQQAASRFRQQAGANLRSQQPPFDVYPTSQHQYHGFQFLQPAESGFVAPHHLNPLLDTAPRSVAPQHQPAILTAATTELNPLIPTGVLFAASPAYATLDAAANNPTDHQGAGSEDDESLDQSSSQLNKGKKRSSDFFASAGQLLLSALPLLLAPTLGLMFASSPLPVARYQAPNTYGGGSNSMHSSIPGEYLNSLNNGQVSNASPVPQIFTPSPPGYNLTTSTSRPTSNSKQATNRLATSASNPVPGVKDKTTPTPQKLTVTLTTLGPPVFVNETGSPQDDQEQGSNNRNKVQSIDHHHHHHHVGNTILLLTGEDATQMESPNATDYKTPTNHTETIAGYEGADYDAQFANLKKHGHPNLHHPQHQQPAGAVDNSSEYLDTRAHQRPPPERSYLNGHHQYFEAPAHENSFNLERPPPQTVTRPTRPEDDDVSTKLYPVSTWPPMRRRAVSLVTINGNKTLLDASDKYQTIDYYTNRHHQHRADHNGEVGLNKAINYTTTFDDSLDESETISGYNSTMQQLGPLSKRNLTTDFFSNQDNQDSKLQHESLDFMLSDGLLPVILKRQPLTRLSKASNIANHTEVEIRTKRQINQTEVTELNGIAKKTSTTLGRPVRVIKRVVPVKTYTHATMHNSSNNQKSRELVNGSLVESASSLDSVAPTFDEDASVHPPAGSQDPMRLDDSKSKSAHIVATMIARLDDEEDAEGASAGARLQPEGPSSDESYNLQSGKVVSSSDVDELKELLVRKKALLARLATNNNTPIRVSKPPVHSFGAQHDESRRIAEDFRPPITEDRFSAGGRGRIPPIEVTPMIKIKLYSNSTKDRERDGAPHMVKTPENRLELSEETKKALANFGTLMMKDSVQMQEPPNEHDSAGRGNDRYEKQAKRWRHESLPTDNYLWHDRVKAGSHRVHSGDNYEKPSNGQATERSISRTTAFPIGGVAFNSDDGGHTSGDMGDIPIDRFRNRPPGNTEFRQRQFNSESHATRRQPSEITNRGDDYGYYHYNHGDEVRSTRPPATHQQQRVRERVNLLDGDYSFGVAADDKPLTDDYHNVYKDRQMSPENRYSSPSSEVDRSNNSNQHRSYSFNYQQTNRPQLSQDEKLQNLRPTNYSATNNTERRSEPPSGVQYGNLQANMRDSSLQQPHGYVYDMRNYPPDPIATYAPATPPPASDIQSYHPSHPYNATSHAPTTYHNDKKPHYQQYNNHHHHHDENYLPVPNGYNRQQPEYFSSGGRANSAYYQPSALIQHHHHNQQHNYPLPDIRYPASSDIYQREMYQGPNRYPQRTSNQIDPHSSAAMMQQGSPLAMSSSQERNDPRSVNDYLKRVQFSDSDRDKLMASYLTCDGLLNDNDHCLERLSCEFSDPQNIERANKLDRAVSSILLGHILINTYIPNQFKLRLKSASLFGYTQSGKCSRYVCSKLSKPNSGIVA